MADPAEKRESVVPGAERDPNAPAPIRAAAKYLGISPAALYRLIEAGLLTHERPTEKRVVVRWRDVEAYRARSTHGARDPGLIFTDAARSGGRTSRATSGSRSARRTSARHTSALVSSYSAHDLSSELGIKPRAPRRRSP